MATPIDEVDGAAPPIGRRLPPHCSDWFVGCVGVHVQANTTSGFAPLGNVTSAVSLEPIRPTPIESWPLPRASILPASWPLTVEVADLASSSRVGSPWGDGQASAAAGEVGIAQSVWSCVHTWTCMGVTTGVTVSWSRHPNC